MFSIEGTILHEIGNHLIVKTLNLYIILSCTHLPLPPSINPFKAMHLLLITIMLRDMYSRCYTFVGVFSCYLSVWRQCTAVKALPNCSSTCPFSLKNQLIYIFLFAFQTHWGGCGGVWRFRDWVGWWRLRRRWRLWSRLGKPF